MEGEPGTQHDTPYVHLSADPQEGMLLVRWKNYAPSGTYRATLDLAVEWMQRFNLRSFLTDQRRRGVILREDQLWLAEDWTPRMLATGMRRAAIVQSKDFFNRQALDHLVDRMQPGLLVPVRFFRTVEEAMAWLTEPGVQPR
jgi:hypothetical protein